MVWHAIEAAPKDGTIIWLSWFEGESGPFDVCKMHWDDEMENGLFPDRKGMWVSNLTGWTWNPHDGGGPTHFAYVL